MPTYTGDMIRKYRTEKGLTQKKLGELCGIADSNIRKYESGNQNPKIETLQKIADALDIPVNRLLAGKIISRDELKEKLSEYGLTHLVPDTEEERTVLENCKKLNETGKKEAAKRVEELTNLPQYINKDNTLTVNAAHSISGASEEDRQFDENIMDDENF